MAAAQAYGAMGRVSSPLQGRPPAGQATLTVHADGLLAAPREISVPWPPASLQELESAVMTGAELRCPVSLSILDADFDELVVVDSLASVRPGATVYAKAKASTSTMGHSVTAMTLPSGGETRRERQITVHSNNGLEHKIGVTASTMPKLVEEIKATLQISTPIIVLAYDKDFGEFTEVRQVLPGHCTGGCHLTSCGAVSYRYASTIFQISGDTYISSPRTPLATTVPCGFTRQKVL